MIESLISSLIKTLIIELIIVIILGVRKKNDIKVVICANVCTNPVIVYITNCILIFSNSIMLYYTVVIILEILVCIVEFMIYKNCLKFNKISPFLLSLISNVLSFGTGLFINNII